MGNCLDRALSDEEDMIGSSSSSSSPGDDTQSLINSTSQLASNSHTTHQQHQQRRRRSHRHHSSNNSSRSHGGMSSLAMPINQRVQANSTFFAIILVTSATKPSHHSNKQYWTLFVSTTICKLKPTAAAAILLFDAECATNS